MLLCWSWGDGGKRLKEWTAPLFLPSYFWRLSCRRSVLFDWSLLKTVVTDGLNSLLWKDIFNSNIISQSAIALVCLRWWVYTERPKKERSIMARYNAALIINITSNYIHKSDIFFKLKIIIIYHFLPRNDKIVSMATAILGRVSMTTLNTHKNRV